MPNSIVFDCPASYSRNISEVRNLTCLKTLYLVGSIKIYRIIKPTSFSSALHQFGHHSRN